MTQHDIHVILDNGHGRNTPGKRSPDGCLEEWAYTRGIVGDVHSALVAEGLRATILVPEDYDVSLGERCRRANAISRTEGPNRCLLVSVHCNAAASDSRWHDAHGWGAYVAMNASRGSRDLADLLSLAAGAEGLHRRFPAPRRLYWEQNLAICRDTLCPAVLTENLFQDNLADVDFLLSARGRAAIARLHVRGIKSYIDKLCGK